MVKQYSRCVYEDIFGPAEMGKAFLSKQRGGNIKVHDVTDV